jgi:tRNA pseudouridine38-40 synthase
MSRYFLEISYKGTIYSGFQVQENAGSIQEEVEKAFAIYFRKPVTMTGASRTDTGVHARQNYFHFDFEEKIPTETVYRLNAILPVDISVKAITPVPDDAHCRFDAESREYRYYIYNRKNPFLTDRAYFYPYPLDYAALVKTASGLMEFEDFTSFSKRNTQVNHFRCSVYESNWIEDEQFIYYKIRANRFLRGMVRGLTGTMLLVGRGQISHSDFVDIIQSKDVTRVNFNVPAKGLFLEAVKYPERFNLGI